MLALLLQIVWPLAIEVLNRLCDLIESTFSFFFFFQSFHFIFIAD